MIQTVNLIEMSDEELLGIRSFEDNQKGNKEAEELFSKVIKEHGATEDEVPSFLDDGYYESGDYQLFLAHSLSS